METTVTGCKDCLLFYDGSQYEFNHLCRHPLAPDNQESWRSPTEIKLERVTEIRKMDISGDDYEYGKIIPITPEWCPLNSESITISKTK